MNRINKLFKEKKKDVLSIYFCAGYPKVDNCAEVIRTLAKNGVDMIEIGVPFSDPMADGVVIQQAATQSLKDGMSLRRLFDQLKGIRDDVDIPLLLMGYLNPIMQYGFDNFCRSCKSTGIDGCIIPDLPFNDYLRVYRQTAGMFDLKMIMLITPETSDERIRLIDAHTDGFIYLVSSAATTGAQQSFDEQKQAYFHRIQSMSLSNPLMIGFGISNMETYRMACENASGAIVGSKFVTLLGEHPSPETAIQKLYGELQLPSPTKRR